MPDFDFSLLPDKQKSKFDFSKLPDKPKSYTLSEVPEEALKEFPSQMVGYVKTFFDPETYKNLSKLLPKPHEPRIPTSEEVRAERGRNIEVAKSMGKYLYGKYGTYENIKRTVAETPVDFLSDLSTFFSGAGAVSKVSKISTIGKAIEPLNVAMAPLKGAKLLASNKVRKLSQRLYNSGIKISNKFDLEETQRIAQRGLDLGILSKREGGIFFGSLKSLRQNMDEIGETIDSAITKGQKTGQYIDTWEVANSLDKLDDIFGSKLFHDPDLPKIIDDLKQSLLDLHGEKIPIEVAQDIKRTTQKFLAPVYNKLSAMQKEAEKIGNAQVRLELEKLQPALKSSNLTQQENIWLKETINNAIKSQEKAPMVPGISFFRGVINQTIDKPTFKERVAIILNRIRKRPIYPSIPTYGRLGIQQVGKIKMEE